MTTIEDLEKKWNVKRCANPIIKYNIDNIPSELLSLIPYLEFFCVDGQLERDEFLETLPQICFKDLHIELVKIEGDYLRDWLAEDTNFNSKEIGDLWSALAILDQIPGEYLD